MYLIERLLRVFQKEKSRPYRLTPQVLTVPVLSQSLPTGGDEKDDFRG